MDIEWKTSSTLRKLIDANGELHLSVRLTEQVLKLIEQDERMLAASDKFLKEIQAELKRVDA